MPPHVDRSDLCRKRLETFLSAPNSFMMVTSKSCTVLASPADDCVNWCRCWGSIAIRLANLASG